MIKIVTDWASRLAHDVVSELLFLSTRRAGADDSCLKLCWLLQQATKSDMLGQWAFSPATYSALFEFYVERSEDSVRRSKKLLLDLLCLLITKNPDPLTSASIRAWTADQTLATVTGQSPRPVAKSTLRVLDHLVSRKVLEIELVATAYRKRVAKSFPDDASLWEALTGDLVGWMKFHYLCPAAGKLVVTTIRAIHSKLKPGCWRQWLGALLSDNPDLLESFKAYIFTPLFVADRQLSLDFLRGLSEEPVWTTDAWDAKALFQVAAFQAGKKTSLVDDPEAIAESGTKIVLQRQTFESAFNHPSSRMRIMALSLLISSSASTKPFPSSTLDMLKSNLPKFHADTDVKTRHEFLQDSKDMVKRLKSATSTLQRSASRGHADAATLLQKHVEFSYWYQHFLMGELVPTVSYQRHFTALKALESVLRDGPSVLGVSSCRRLVLDRMMDPFDDVREAASGILTLLPIDRPAFDLFHSRGSELAIKTGRACLADGMAKAAKLSYSWAPTTESRFALLDKLVQALELSLDMAEADLGQAVMNSQLHGIFAALK